MADTIQSLKKKISELDEQIDDLQVQLNAMTDEFQKADKDRSNLQAQLEKSEDRVDPSGGLGGGALLRSYCLHLATLDPGLTVGQDYDLDASLDAARDFWIEQGGRPEDLD